MNMAYKIDALAGALRRPYRIRCLNFAGALFAVADLIVGHEKLELPDRSSSD